jgi:dTMP kinase
MWIAFEGHDGSGKTSTAELMVEQLSSSGKDVKFVRAPGSSTYGSFIRSNWHKNEKVRFLQLMANHVEIIEEIVLPHLASGGWVVQDRTFMSCLVYSGWAGLLPLEALVTTGHLWINKQPDRLFIFNCPTKTAVSRLDAIKKDLDDPDEYTLGYIKAGYRIEGQIKNAVFVDTDKPQNEVLEECLAHVL